MDWTGWIARGARKGVRAAAAAGGKALCQLLLNRNAPSPWNIHSHYNWQTCWRTSRSERRTNKGDAHGNNSGKNETKSHTMLFLSIFLANNSKWMAAMMDEFHSHFAHTHNTHSAKLACAVAVVHLVGTWEIYYHKFILLHFQGRVHSKTSIQWIVAFMKTKIMHTPFHYNIYDCTSTT